MSSFSKADQVKLGCRAKFTFNALEVSDSEIEDMQRSLSAMVNVARNNIIVATAAARASEKLHLVALDFVKEVQQ